MDTKLIRSVYVTGFSPQFDVPEYHEYIHGPHNPVTNGGKLYERTRIKTLVEERERIQKKTFTKWSNTFLKNDERRIEDLFTDLCDGRILLRLVERVSGYKLPPPTPGRMRIHCLENVEKSLAFLDNLNVHLENIGAHDIVDGNSRIILGLIWTIILRFQIQNISVIEKVRRIGYEEPIDLRRNSTEALLLWCKAKTKNYPDVSVTNFTTSWRDGLAFAALIHKHRPDLIDFDRLSPEDPIGNLHIAFTTAERCLGIAKLLDPEDCIVEEPDEKSIITYLVSYYHYFAREKANTVHARRIERVINLLRRFINDVKNYEVSAEKLMQWIHESIARMDGASLENNLEGLQDQLSELSYFRTQEKSPRFHEKGEMEIAFFSIKSEMLAVGMRVYIPPKKLRISDVNKSWETLERCEYKRWLDLNDELRKQEMLDQLYAKFEKKCSMRESWLLENQQIAEQELVESSQYVLQVAFKKHEAFEADVYAYEDRIGMLIQIAKELKRCRYFREHAVSSRCQKVENQWLVLLDTIKNRRKLIQNRISYIESSIEFDGFMKHASRLKERIDRIETGNSEEQITQSLMSIEAADNEIKTLCIQVEILLRRQGDEYGEELEKEWVGMEEQVVLAAEEKRKLIEMVQQQFRLLPDIARFRNLVQARMRFLQELGFQFTYAVMNRIHRQVRYMEEDLNSKQGDVTRIAEVYAGSRHDGHVGEFLASWGLLTEILASVKKKTVIVGDVLFLDAEIDDASSWIAEKSKVLDLQCGSSAESAVRINQRLLEEVELYQRDVEHICEKASTLKDEFSDFDNLPEDFVKGQDSFLLVRSLSDVRSEVCQVLNQKPATLLTSYMALLERVKRKQATLIDALSVKQFLNSSSQVRSWIIEKACLLDRITPANLGNIWGRAAKPEFLEEFDFFARHLEGLENQMSEMADRIAAINKTAANILEAASAGKVEDLKDVLIQVIDNRNSLNDAWNQLADRIEDFRYRLNLDQIFFELSRDCSFTKEWIAEKMAIILRHRWTDIPSVLHLSRLNMVLKSIKSDSKVIRAKIEDMGERVAATYRIPDEASLQRTTWLYKQQDELFGRVAELDRELKKCEDLISLHGRHLNSAQSLADFLKWITTKKEKSSCTAIPSSPKEARLSLAAQQDDLVELLGAEKHLEKLLADYEKLLHTQEAGSPVREAQVDPEQVIEEYAQICEMVRRNIDNLSQEISSLDNLSELGALETMVARQEVYLDHPIHLESLEAVETSLKNHATFTETLLNTCNRFNILERRSCDLTDHRGSLGGFNAKLHTLREKLERNKRKSHDRERILKEELRLQELLNDFRDIEDWMAEKQLALNQLTLTSKRDVHSAYGQVKALQEEIEASRGRAEGLIEIGKQLINSCPRTDPIVSARIDDIYMHWEALLKELHNQMLTLEESHREYLLNETVQDLLRWVAGLLERIKMDVEDPTLATSGLAEFQRRTEVHRRDCQDYDNYNERAAALREHIEVLAERFPDRTADFAAVSAEVGKKLEVVDAALEQREELLNLHASIASHLLDLNSELLWVKDKLVQVRQPYDDWTPKDRWSVGKQLLRVQQEKRRLANHIAEVENRGPRVKTLCLLVKETYLGTAQSAGPRLGSFRDVLGELEQAWYTATHLLEVRREELRLAEMAHKFSFDVVNLEAWVSERELYLQTINEPSNIAEAQRALRQLNVLLESVNQWSDEVKQTKRRSNELARQLSSGVQINGNYVQAPPAASRALAKAATRLVNDFSLLQKNVLERRRDLGESVSLYDIMQDVKDLEEWIAERQKTANNPDVGTNLEHTFTLHERFHDFAKCTRTEGDRRMKSMLSRMDQMILRGHKNRSEIALAKDGLNEDWADLLEMLTTRRKILKSALTLHRFFSDTQYIEKQIEECYHYLPSAPTTEMVTGASDGLAVLRRRQAGLELRLTHIKASCAAVADAASALLPAYAGEAEARLRVRLDCVLSAAQQLAAAAGERAHELSEAQRLHRFFVMAKELLEWLAEAKKRMSQPNGLSRTTYAVERMIGEQRQLYAELGMKVKQVEECLEEGRAILSLPATPPMDQPPPSPASGSRLFVLLTAPQGAVRETCVALATERILAEALWRERWERLLMLLDARYYLRDAAAAESWLGSREVFLVSVRRNIGETLAETLALLGAHYAFEKACASAEERFAALKRLTKLEVHALEWKPEDATRYEREKRERIRKAVHEFLPPVQGFSRLPPSLPPMPSRPQKPTPNLRSLSTRIGHATCVPQDSFRRTSPVTRTAPLAHYRPTWSSLPTKPPIRKSEMDGDDDVEELKPRRPFSSGSTAEGFYLTKKQVSSMEAQVKEGPTSTDPPVESEERETMVTTSITRQQGSFPSTSAYTPPPADPPKERKVAGREASSTATTEELPRVEGPLIRKWEADPGGIRHSRGRSWNSVYVTLIDGKLNFYKDRRTRREQESETFHGEAPLNLAGVIAIPALDYTKRPFVFRLRLASGAEYLLQAVSAEVLQRWVEAINDTAKKLSPRDVSGRFERAQSLPTSARRSRASSAASALSEEASKPRRHSSLRRILKRS